MTIRDSVKRLGAALAVVAVAWPLQAQVRPMARPADLAIPSPEEAIIPVSATPAVVPPGPSMGPETNLPLPRFVSLKTDEGNARRGPALDQRIDWVFVREDMPLQITAEYGHWRRVEDRDGEGGWVHYSLLSGTRTVIVDQDRLPLRSRPEDNAPEIALLEQNVIARLETCEVEWCRIGAGGYGGWAHKTALWGVGADEVLD
jgi:SH3-like domain-containing protein